MILILDPLAQREYNDAFEYYEAKEEGLGEKFRNPAHFRAGIEIDRPCSPKVRKSGWG